MPNANALLTPLAAIGILATIAYSEVITRRYEPPGPVHVSYWEKWTDFEGDAIRNVVNYYNAHQGLKDNVHVDLLTVSGIEQKTLFSVSAGVPPDIAGLYGPNVAQYADDHAVMRLDSLCAENGISAEQYIPAYWNIGYYHNHVYSLPTTPASTALHYNKNMFRAAGLNPDQPPKTLEEMDSDSFKITTRDASGGLVHSGFLVAEPGWWHWGWGYIFGGRLWDGGTRITANSPENIAAYKWIAQDAEKYHPTDLQTFQSGFGNFSSPQNAFLSQKVAMELQGVWMYNFISKFSPELEKPTREWAAVPFPYPASRPDLANSTFVDEDVVVIPEGARHPDAAFKFIKYLESQEGMEMLCLGQRKHSPLVKVSPEFYAKHPNPFIKLFADLPRGKNTYFPPKLGIWPEYSDELKAAIDSVQLLKKTPEQALNDVQARIQPRLTQYLERLKLRGEAAN